jgi:hypothetical protein
MNIQHLRQEQTNYTDRDPHFFNLPVVPTTVQYKELAPTHWGQEPGFRLFRFMLNWRLVLYQHNIDILYNGSEKRSRNARTIERKSVDIFHLETSFKSDE